jgi:hypothetical protein
VILEALSLIARALLAIPAALLPWRHWSRLAALPIEHLSLVSGITTAAIGFLVGTRGFLEYAWRAADATVNATLEVAANQLRGGVSKGEWITSTTMQHFSVLSIFAFILFTPLGWLATYLVVTGLWRAIAGWAEDPFGDPILTGVDAALSGSWRGARQSRQRRARERLEGAEVPDRLYTGEWAKLPGVDFVVVASRRKPEWTKGTFVITSDRWYTLGEPYDFRLPGGVRTVYPLTAQRTNEVLRKGVPYELPPLEPR